MSLPQQSHRLLQPAKVWSKIRSLDHLQSSLLPTILNVGGTNICNIDEITSAFADYYQQTSGLNKQEEI